MATAESGSESDSERGVLIRDERPVFTLWRVDGVCSARKPRTVWIVQAEGGAVTSEAAEAFINCLMNHIYQTEGSFTTLYDFTQKINNLLPHVMELAHKAAEIRQNARNKPVRTVLVCPNAFLRNLILLILNLVGTSDRPHAIVACTDAGWEKAFETESANEKTLTDTYEGVPPLEGIDFATSAAFSEASLKN